MFEDCLPEIFFGPFLNTFSHFDAGSHSLLSKPKVCMRLFKNSQNQHDNALVRWQLKLLRPFFVEPGLKSHGVTGETLKQEASSFYEDSFGRRRIWALWNFEMLNTDC